jgi:hypothetical protein
MKGVLGFGFRIEPEEVFVMVETKFKAAVMNPGSCGVVISRTSVGYWYVRRKIRVSVIIHIFLVEIGSGF